MPRKVKRPYASVVRQKHAATTRLAVIAAAARLFVERGYAATTIDEIAEAAGVARATVFTSVGGKAALLKAAYDVAIVGDDQAVSLVERPRSQRILHEPDPGKMLAAYAGVATEIDARLAGIHEALRAAASVDADARALWHTIQAQRRVGGDNLVRPIVQKGRLKKGLDAAAAADLVWVLNDPGLFHMLVTQRGWTRQRFQQWLGETLQRQLLVERRISE